MSHDPAPTPATATMDDVTRLVRRFYERARADAELGPVFERADMNWEAHFGQLDDFWAAHLIGNRKYKGSPFMTHVGLGLEPAHFSRWLALFRQTCDEVLSPADAERAYAKAEHMGKSLTAGLFPIPGRGYRPPKTAE